MKLLLIEGKVSYKITLGQIGDTTKERLLECPYCKRILGHIADKYMQEDATSKKFLIFKFNNLRWLMVNDRFVMKQFDKIEMILLHYHTKLKLVYTR